ncbi:lysosomal-trafficking regulator isoform X1 [Lampetra planeri]
MYRASALSLYRAWESFNEARSADDAEEREARLDKFLALLHHYRWKGNLCLFELEKICPAMNAGACNVLARELLTDIHQLCRNLAEQSTSSPGSSAPVTSGTVSGPQDRRVPGSGDGGDDDGGNGDGDEDEEEEVEDDEEEERRQEQQRRRESGHVTALADYLLAGRGFTLLLTLDSLLNQELACREDLLNLLLSLLPLLWKIPVREEQARAYHLPPLGENLFSASSSQAFSQPQPSPSRKGTAFPLSGRYNCSGGSASRKHRRHRKGGPGHEARDKAQAPHASTDSELSSSERPTAAATLLANWRQVAPNRSLASTGLFTSEDFSPPKPGGSYPSPLGESLERFGCGGAAMEEQAARLADVEAHVQPSIETEVQRLPVCELDVVNANDPSGLVLGLGRDAHVADGTPFELCRVLLSLLGKLCEAELASATRGQASVCTVLPSLLRFLSALGGGDRNSETGVMAAGWTGETVAFVQRMLLHAVLRLLTATNAALHGEADGMPDALRTAALDLLNAARLAKLGLERPRAEPFAPRLKRTLKEVQQQEEEEKLALYKCLEPQDESKSRYHWLLLLPELIHATLQLMLRYVQAAGSNPFLLNQAVDLIQEFVKQQGFDLLQESLVDLEALVSSVATQQQQRQHHLLLPSPSLPMGALEVRDARVYIRILVDDITEVISALKKARVEQVYPASGHRKRHHHQPFHHRACPQPSCPQEHHHSDLSGLPMCAFTPSRMPLNPFEEQDDEGREDAASLGATGKTTDGLCCVAIFSARCLAMLESVQTSEFALRVLSGTSGAGVCCCLDLHAALRPILRSLWSPVGAGSKAYQQYALAVLGKLLLDQLGGNHQGNVDGKPKPSTACQICESAADDDGSGLDSAAQSGGSSPSSAQAVDRPRRWEALAAYRGPVLGEAGPGAALLVARHLCHLARRGGPELRRQLYVHVLSPAIRQGVEATQHARQLGLGGEAAAGGCVHACHLHARCPSPQLIRKCLEAVPVLLQHRSLLELFLVSDGLSQVTELLFLEEVRPAALAVFHTLILALEGQGPEEAEGPEPVQRSSEASQRDAANSAHLAPDSPQSDEAGAGSRRRLSRLCAGLRDGHVTPMRRKKSHGDGSPEFHHNNHHHHQHHHHNQHHHQQRAADLFLCVTLLSVTRDEGGEDSTDRDSEDTSGYDSTPCVCVGERYGASSLPRLSPDCAALPTSDGEVRLAADVWASCRRLCQASLAFRGRLARSGALQVCRRLTAIIIKDLSPSPGAPRQDGLAGRRPKAAPAAEDNDAGASAALPRTQSNTSSDFSSTEQLTTEVHVAAAALSESSETITQQEPADGDQTLRAESCDGSLQRPPDDDGDDADAPDAEVTPTSEAGDGWPASCRSSSIGTSKSESVGQRLDGHAARAADGHAAPDVKREATSNNEEGRWCACETERTDRPDRPELVKIRLLEALLAVCLHGCTLTGSQQRDNDLPGQGFSTKDLLKELWGLLAESGLLATELARPLCEALLRVALTGGPPDDALLDFDDKKRADEELFPLDGEWSADPFDDPEEVKGMQPEHSPGGGCSGEEGGYEADSESNPDDNTEEGSKDESAPRLAPGPAFPLGMDGGPAACASPQPLPGQLAYPELCVLVLKLLAAAPLELSVATRVFRTLLEIARGGEQNRVALYQQGVVKTLLIGFTALLGQADPAMRECQTALVDLLVAMTTSHMSSEELALLLRLFSEQRPPTELLLSGLSQVVQANTQAVPSHFLSFPTAQGGGAALHAMARVATAGVKARAASPVQRAFQEFLRCTRPDPSRKDDGGGGGAAPPRGPASPWVISSVRLALPAEHQAWGQQHTGRPAGFSASLWLRVGWGPGGEDNGAAAAGGAGERVRRSKKNRLLVFRDSSIDSPEGERVVVIDYPNPHKAGDRMVDEGLLHLLSFGSRSLMLQVWAEPDAGLLTFRVVVDAGDGKKVDLLAQAETAEDVLALGQWQHLALSYQQRPEGKRNAHGRLAVWIDGCRVSEMALDFVVPPARKPTSPADAQRLHCLLGHSVGSQEEAERLLGSWSLGNLMVFYDAILTPEFAFHLFACGPDTRSILPCKQRSPAPVYSKYVTLAMLEGGNLKDLLACSSEFNLSPLVMNLCLTYCPSHPTRYTVYDFPAPTQSRVPGRAPPPAKAPSPRDIKLVPDGPEVLRAPQPSSHRGLQSSVYKIGGTSAFIFLFARVVELSESEVTQAKALEVALSLARRHQKRVQEMSDCHGYAMIYEVLTKKRCLVGFHTLKVLLEACCDGVVLRWSRERSRFELERESDAVIQDVELLASLLLAWNVWMRAPAGVWETLLTALEILIRPNHPAQMFNIQQLLRARVVDQLLLTCQVLQENRSEGSASLPLAVSHSFVKIIGEVLGSPPDAALLASVCRFLLAVHPPDATYVCHASVGFYFTLRANGRALDERISAISALRRDQAQSSTPIMSPATAPSTTFPFHPATVPPASRGSPRDSVDLVDAQPDVGRVQPASSGGGGGSPRLRRQRAMRQREASLDELREVSEHESDTPSATVLRESRSTRVRARRASGGSGSIVNSGGSARPKAGADPGPTTERGGDAVLSSDRAGLRGTVEENLPDRDCVKAACNAAGMDQSAGPAVTGLDNCATGRSSAGRECHSEILKRKCGVGRRVADTESSLSPSSSSSSNVSEHVRGSLATADAFAAAQQRSRHEHQPVGEAAVPAPDARMFRRSNTNEFSAEGTVDESSGGPSEQEGMGEQTVSDGGRVPRLQRMMSRHWDLGLAFPGSGAGLGSSKGVWKSSTSLGEWDTVSGATTASGSTLSLGSPMQHCSVPEDGLMLVCCGLYHLLQGVLLNLPDSMLPLVTEQLLTAETLLVLANHRSPLQRLAVVKLLDVYFQRVSDDQKAAFVKMHGLYLLANQLHQRAATHGLAEALLSMLLACPSALDEELELQAVRECPSFQRRWGVPLLALAESSLHDTPLAHNLLCALLQLFGACTRLADVLLDSGLLSTLCNIVALLTGIAEGGLAQWECRLLLGDVQQLLVAATIHACSTGGGQYLRLLDDLVVLLNCLQGSANPRTQGVAVALQFRVLQAAVDLVRSVADTESQGMTSSFVLPSAPHHALQQKRRSIAGTSVVRDSIIPRQPRQRLAPFAFPTGSPPLGRPDASLLCTLGHDAGAGASMAPHSDTLLLMRMRSVASDELSRLVQRRMSQDNSLRAPEAELIQRLQRVTVMAVNRILFQDPVHDEVEFADLPMTPSAGQPPSIHCGSPLSDEEDRAEWPMAVSTRLAFQRQIFHMMLDGLKIAVECGKSNAPRQQWRRILWACRETFRAQLGRLLVHVLSPLRSPAERRLGLEVVAEPNCKEMLRETLSSPPQARHGPKLALYVSELLREQGREGRTLGRKEQRAAEVLLNLLRQCGYKSVPPGAPPKADVVEAVREEREKFQKEEESNREAWVRRMTTNGQALLGRIETRARSVSRVAAEVTQRVAGRQGLERKKVIAHIREAYKAELSAQRCWQTLFRQLTHERAVWFDPVACPSSWQLDPTEGPNRERRRLQRCHITIPNKYLLKDRWTSAADAIKLPLSFLFDDKSSSSGSSAVKDKATSEPTKFTRRCISVVPSRETPGELLLGETGMYFVEDSTGDATETPSCVGEAEALSFSWTYEDIKEVHLRWWQLRDNALEVFLTNGRTLLLTFDSTKVRDQVYQTILSSDLPNLLEYGNLSALTQLWCAGQITNFEYLTHLNKHAGRSFNDLMQYPVFPFVLRDYASETLDLADPKVYRNLVKPIAVQCKEKEDRYINNYKWLEEEYRKGGREDDPMPPVQPYHYGSHYSNSGTVLHFLVRLPPFTKMFLAYQDQSFDIPDRTFHSMVTTWRLSSYESTTDVKELVPEFFYLPEFLANREGFDFGLRQNGDRVNHVTLPLWARGDPRLFVLLQRQALESENVSLSLCHWIDLVFGHKQKGKAAVQAINVFHPATYFGMDVSAVEDPVQRRALETMIKTYGQTPRQLFSSQHPTRGAPRSPVEADITSAMGMLVQLAFRETRETRDHARETVAPSPLPWIKGLRWGEYVGSPSCPDPMVCFSQPHPGQRFGSLLALPTRVVCGLAPNFCLMMTYSKEQGVRSMHNTDIHWSAILSWGYADNILRLKSKQTEPPVSFIQCDAADQVSSCAWVPDGCQLFTGNQEGVVTAYVTRFSAATPSELEVESCVHLYGHTDAVALLHVCKPYSVLVSASIDGTCIVWDLNRLCYVQSLTGHKSPVMAVSASETTGDIATACSSVGGGSDLRLWTVNGDLIGHVHSPEMVRSLAFSNQPEGTSVNVIAGGLETGVVRLWSTWDLKPVREIAYPKSGLAVISLTFSCDGLHLFTVDSEGKVVAWCRRDHARSKPPLFYSFLGSFSA